MQLLNYTMPIVEEQIYDEGAYSEANLTLEKVIFEAIGLNDITTYGIIGSEIMFFNGFDDISGSNIANLAEEVSTFAPFKLDDESISMISEEELREISENSSVYNPALKEVLEKEDLEILIYHTHSQESYAEIGKERRWYSPNKDFNITGVGRVLTQELEEGYGIKVIHDETTHDTVYGMSYEESNKTVKRYLSEYDDFDLILDLHRDSAPRSRVLTNINDETLARLMFVIGKNSAQYEANRELAGNLVEIGEELFPTIFREELILEYNTGTSGGFNLGLNKNMALIEVGSIGNAAEEARRTAKYIARIIAEYLYDKISE